MTVYVVQYPMTYDSGCDDFVPKYKSMDKAKDWGDMHVLLRSFNLPHDYDEIKEILEEELQDAGECDYLIPIGEQISCSMATLIFAKNAGGIVPMLKFDQKAQQYYEYIYEVEP